MIRTIQQQQEHDSLVTTMVRHFTSLGYLDIKADIPGFKSPNIVQGEKRDHRPDLTCFKNDANKTPIILEAETCDTLTGEHTVSQWSLFSSRAKNINGEFHVIAPITCKDKMLLLSNQPDQRWWA